MERETFRTNSGVTQAHSRSGVALVPNFPIPLVHVLRGLIKIYSRGARECERKFLPTSCVRSAGGGEQGERARACDIQL